VDQVHIIKLVTQILSQMQEEAHKIKEVLEVDINQEQLQQVHHLHQMVHLEKRISLIKKLEMRIWKSDQLEEEFE
jgi:hypothetical protein